MINRNNKYKSISNKSLSELLNKGKKKMIILLGGLILSVSLFSGCDNMSNNSYIKNKGTEPIYYDVTIEQGELLSLGPFINTIRIIETDLKDVSELSNYKYLQNVYLIGNNITDISPLESLPIERLDITYNNVKNINIEKFQYLRLLYIEGNYNLYTQELVDYCEKNNITIDITKEDVKNVEAIKEMLKSIDFDGKTDFQKEQAICDFVCKHMKYDFGLYKKIITNQLDEDFDVSGLENAVKGKGVCESYATLFTAMCQLSGINSYKKNGQCLIEPHVWSLVEIDGQYILCDPTNVDNSLLFGNYFLSNSMGDDARTFMSINETSNVVRNQVETSDKSKFHEYEEEKRHELMVTLLKCAALGSIVFIPVAVAKIIKKKREQIENESNQVSFNR